VQSVEIVQQIQQMFMVECQKVHGIQMAFHITEAYRDLNVDIVMLDSSRLFQVVGNQEAQYFSLGVSWEFLPSPLAGVLTGFILLLSSYTCTRMLSSL